MNLAKIKDFFSHLGGHDLPTAAAVLVGIILLYRVFVAGKSYAKVVAFLIAVGLFTGAWWCSNTNDSTHRL